MARQGSPIRERANAEPRYAHSDVAESQPTLFI
jgi:hypothetical protein